MNGMPGYTPLPRYHHEARDFNKIVTPPPPKFKADDVDEEVPEEDPLALGK